MFELPKLNYAFDALEPFIDTATMQIHYGKHHQAYCTNFNTVLAKYPDLESKTAEEILKELKSLAVTEEDRKKIQNMGGGYVNHSLFWQMLDPANQPDETLKSQIAETFGSIENFKEEFTKQATSHFASGWTWLVRDNDGKLLIYSLPNQDSPLTLGHTPILTIDLWEHAYYLKFQNRRPEYIENWWKTIKMI